MTTRGRRESACEAIWPGDPDKCGSEVMGPGAHTPIARITAHAARTGRVREFFSAKQLRVEAECRIVSRVNYGTIGAGPQVAAAREVDAATPPSIRGDDGVVASHERRRAPAVDQAKLAAAGREPLRCRRLDR